MNQPIKTRFLQTQLFPELRLSGGPDLHELSTDLQAELKARIAELLLNTALAEIEQSRRGTNHEG